jgi:hypothetical protein
MPSEHSIYRKIQVILEIAKSANIETIPALQKLIERKNLVTFHTRHFDRDKDSFVIETSEKAIHNALRLCQDLKLVKTDGSLTEKGRQAIQRAKFEQVIANQILTCFREAGIQVSELNKLILESIQSNPPVMPTSSVLWAAIEEKMHHFQFSRMISLLAQCGGAESSQKKVYLRIG